MAMVRNFKIEFKPDVTLTETEGRLVLFSKKTGDFFGLNDSAKIFLEELSQNDFLTTLKVAGNTYDLSESELTADLLSLVEDLERQNILKKILIP